jgi:hypothetical protein
MIAALTTVGCTSTTGPDYATPDKTDAIAGDPLLHLDTASTSQAGSELRLLPRKTGTDAVAERSWTLEQPPTQALMISLMRLAQPNLTAFYTMICSPNTWVAYGMKTAGGYAVDVHLTLSPTDSDAGSSLVDVRLDIGRQSPPGTDDLSSMRDTYNDYAPVLHACGPELQQLVTDSLNKVSPPPTTNPH